MRYTKFSSIILVATAFTVLCPCRIDAFTYPSASVSTVITNKFQTLKRVSFPRLTNPLASTSISDDNRNKNSESVVKKVLKVVDDLILSRVIRVANHLPAFLSLAYFGTISMASMMMNPAAEGTMKTATLTSVLSQSVGPTTNRAFAAYFPTLITPAAPVFLVWPLIAILQSITLTVSSLFPSDNEKILLTQSDLSSLTLANICSTAWLIASSNASPSHLPLASFLILPFVPLFSGYPLRNETDKNKSKMTTYYNNKWVFQVFSSFTTIASILAFTVELQYGGRIPFIGKVGSELAASIFLGLYSTASLTATTNSDMKKSRAKRLVNFGALSGILYKRMMVTTTSLLSVSGWWSLLGSVSFWGTAGCWVWSVKELFFSNSN